MEFQYNTAMVKLVKDGDRVSGIIATNADGDYVRINASKGVIVCTGGYGQNIDMLAALQPKRSRRLATARPSPAPRATASRPASGQALRSTTRIAAPCSTAPA